MLQSNVTVWLLAFDGEEAVDVGSEEPVVPGEEEGVDVGDAAAVSVNCPDTDAWDPLDGVGVFDGEEEEGPGDTEGIRPTAPAPEAAPFP